MPGMTLEIVDLEYAMPLPEPELARQPDSFKPQSQSVPQQQSFEAAVTASSSRIAPQPQQTAAVAKSVAAPAQLAPAPVAPIAPALAPAKAAAPRSSFDSSAVTRLLASKSDRSAPARLNSGVISTAIGTASPRGTAGLTARQQSNLAEMIRKQVTPCWNPPIADETSGHVVISLRIQLDREGQVVGLPVVVRVAGQNGQNGAYANALAGSVRRAAIRCAPIKLPAELYDAWANVELNFDPRDVL